MSPDMALASYPDTEAAIPNGRWGFEVRSGRYRLSPAREASQKALVEFLPDVRNVEGSPDIRTVADVERLLTARSRGPARAPHPEP
jgi:hypothetical protein